MEAQRLFAINLLAVAAAILLHIALNVSGIARGSYCLLSFSELSLVCPLGFLQRPDLMLTATYAILIGLAIVFLFIMALGRVFCGWLCPLGIGLRLINGRKPGGGGRTIALAFSISLILTLPASWVIGFPIFCLICPIGVVSRLIISALSGTLDPWSIIWGAAIFATIAAGIRLHRWCGGICPLGALQTLLSRLKILRIRSTDKCRECDLCARACPLGLEIHRARQADQMSCTTCLMCAAKCPFKSLKLQLTNPLHQGGPKS